MVCSSVIPVLPGSEFNRGAVVLDIMRGESSFSKVAQPPEPGALCA